MFGRSKKRPGSWGFAALAIVVAVQSTALWATTTINSCSTTIREPGHYVLVADLECGFYDGIIIEADYVTLELNGHNITGFSGRNYGIHVDGTSHVFVLGPSTISGFTTGMFFEGSYDSTVSMVTFTGNDLGLVIAKGRPSNRNTFENNTASNNAAGFWINDAEDNIFRGNTATGNVLGFVLDVGAGRHEHANFFQNNTANNNNDGFEINGEDNSFLANTATNNRNDGFILRSGAHGMHLDSNIADGNGFAGIYAKQGATHNVINDNSAHGNTFYDLYEGSGSCVNLWENNSFDRANESCIH